MIGQTISHYHIIEKLEDPDLFSRGLRMIGQTISHYTILDKLGEGGGVI